LLLFWLAIYRPGASLLEGWYFYSSGGGLENYYY